MVNDWKITAITAFEDDATLHGMWPRMHGRGRDMTFVATLPAPHTPVCWSEQNWDEMFNGWREVSVDKDVLTAPTTTQQQ